jgi:hypothetical protein
MNRPVYVDARRRLDQHTKGTNAPPVADAVLALAWSVLAVAEAINLGHKESSR